MSAGSSASSFSTGSDSPVSADSSTRRSVSVSSRASAATLSPVSITSTSPTTTSVASITRTSPSRSTRARGLDSRLSASSAVSARYSCDTPMMTLATTMSAITTASKTSFANTDTTAAPASRYTIGLAICSRTSLPIEVPRLGLEGVGTALDAACERPPRT